MSLLSDIVQKMNILFSPIGGTDPISNYRDGALLHICRHFQPDKVYLYMSSEICERHDKDDRYLYCLERLGKMLDHSFEYELICRENLRDVHVFDYFMDEFRHICYEILQTEKVDKFYLNISSGTPAMKSVLLLLSVVSNGRFIPVQVSTPEKRQNPHAENPIHYEVQDYWELNEDNQPGTENRCTIADSLSWLWEIKKEIVKKHIQAYDYVAALQVLDDTPHGAESKLYRLLKAADYRMKLDFKGMEQQLRGLKMKFQTSNDPQQRDILEYTLGLQIRLKKREYADFIRALSPLLWVLYDAIIYQETNLNVRRDLCKKLKEEHYRWDLAKVNQNKRISDILRKRYKIFRGGDVGNNHLNVLAQGLCEDRDLRSKIKMLESVEKNVRNIAAHEIVAVTGKKIQERSGVSAEKILSIVKELVEQYVIGGNAKKIWDSYDSMNQMIIQVMETEDLNP